MKKYWLWWIILTLFKAGILIGAIFSATGGVLNFEEYGLLAIIFIPFSLWFLHDFIYQLLVPLTGGTGWRLHKPSDTPVYMGLAPSWKEARNEIRKGHCIIWS